jgi:hypothetical protein
LGIRGSTDNDIETLIGLSWQYAKQPAGTAPTAERAAFNKRAMAPVWYSKMAQVLDKKLPGSNSAQGMKALLQSWANKGEFKTDELKWSGVIPWLEGKNGAKVTKQELVDFVKANQLEIKETVRGGGIEDTYSGKLDDIEDRLEAKGWAIEYAPDFNDAYTIPDNLVGYGEVVSINREAGEVNELPDDVKAIVNELYDLYDEGVKAREGTDVTTRYSDYQLPGGENYREMLFTMPIQSRDTGVIQKAEAERLFAEGDAVYGMDWNGQWDIIETTEDIDSYNAFSLEPESVNFENLKAERNIKDREYQSPHWSEPNVLAHVRFNDRTDAQGKKTLFIEEIQSDWHQQGKKKGYKEIPSNWTVEQGLDKLNPKEWMVFDNLGELKGYGATKEAAIDMATAGAVLPAPFSKTWHEFVLKRILRYAAENGYDAIGWTTGEQQAERYDLSKYLNELRYAKTAHDKEYYLHGFDNNDQSVIDVTVPIDKLEETVGKEITQKILNGEGAVADAHGEQKLKVLSGLDLKVGGEGMKGFYDKIIPDFLNKYGKQWGAKVGETNIETFVQSDEDFKRLKNIKGMKGEIPVHSFPITSAMKESVLYEGQPMFKRETSSTAKKIGRELAEQIIHWKKILSDYYSHALKGQHLPIMMTTPQVLRLHRIGMKDLPVVITADALTKAHNKHGLTTEMLEQIPLAITEPIMVFKSATDTKSFVVMTGITDNKGRTVIVPIQVDQRAGRHIVNNITSIYGHENNPKSGKPEWFITQIKEGRLLYMDKEKALKWSQSAGLQLPLEETIQNLKNKIHTENDIVKPFLGESAKTEEEVKPSFRKGDIPDPINDSQANKIA